jgi:hypothetical protein
MDEILSLERSVHGRLHQKYKVDLTFFFPFLYFQGRFMFLVDRMLCGRSFILYNIICFYSLIIISFTNFIISKKS